MGGHFLCPRSKCEHSEHVVWYSQQTVNIKSPHILQQCFKIFKIFILIENSHIFIPIFRVLKYIHIEFVCNDIFTIVVWALTHQLMNMPSLFVVWHLV
jgi:hypothetical protein